MILVFDICMGVVAAWAVLATVGLWLLMRAHRRAPWDPAEVLAEELREPGEAPSIDDDVNPL